CRYIARLGRSAFGIQVDPEKRASFLNKFLRESWHVADRETNGIHEGAFLDPPAKSLCKSFLTFRIERARSAQFFDGSKDVQRRNRTLPRLAGSEFADSLPSSG
ncbi:MAG: hypothetical protein WCF38_23955, partial [Pseudolabrys sp.]